MNWKKIVIIVLDVILAVYLLFAVTSFNKPEGANAICNKVKIDITDGVVDGFLNVDEIKGILERNHLYPLAKPMNTVDIREIEETLVKSPFVNEAQCYKTQSGHICIKLTQRMPIIRIKANNGDDYYIDSRGNLMNPQNYAADLIVATGNIDRKFARKELVKLGCFLHDDPFWDAQIVQIHVLPNHHLELVPRVGGHTIAFGSTDSISQKFRNLYTFYEKVLPQVGWNKYKEISVEHVTQIVGRKG